MSIEKSESGQIVAHFDALGAKIDGMKTVIDLRLKGIDEHLGNLNSKVATHERRLGGIELEEAERKGARDAKKEFTAFKWKVWGTIIGGLGLSLVTALIQIAR